MMMPGIRCKDAAVQLPWPHHSGGGVKLRSLERYSLLAALVALSVLAAPTAEAQSRLQLACELRVQQDGRMVAARAVIFATQPTRADYTVEALKIDRAGSGATEQSGSVAIDAGETVTTSVSRFSIAEDGWIEFHLKVTERLTGQTCEDEQVISPL